jgi:hypothetical protein
LTEYAIFFAFAALFDLFALVAADFRFGRHGGTLSLVRRTENIPLVTKSFEPRATSYEP